MEIIVREKHYNVYTMEFKSIQIAYINNEYGIWMNNLSYLFKSFNNERDAKTYFNMMCEFIGTGKIFYK